MIKRAYLIRLFYILFFLPLFSMHEKNVERTQVTLSHSLYNHVSINRDTPENNELDSRLQLDHVPYKKTNKVYGYIKDCLHSFYNDTRCNQTRNKISGECVRIGCAATFVTGMLWVVSYIGLDFSCKDACHFAWSGCGWNTQADTIATCIMYGKNSCVFAGLSGAMCAWNPCITKDCGTQTSNATHN